MCDTLDSMLDSFTDYMANHDPTPETDYIKHKALEDDFMRFCREQKDTVRPKFEKPKKDHNVLTWGKYKGKNITDVYKLDDKYIKWLSQNPYTSSEQKDIIRKLSK